MAAQECDGNDMLFLPVICGLQALLGKMFLILQTHVLTSSSFDEDKNAHGPTLRKCRASSPYHNRTLESELRERFHS